MSSSPLAPLHSAVAARLRAAGCVFADDEAALLIDAAHTPAELDAMIDLRVDGSPLEHVVGWAQFCGLRVAVVPGVFVPRRRTELLVAQAAALLRPGSIVVDLCCGSGAVAAALLAESDAIELYASDIDPAAVRCARVNIAERGHVLLGDLDDALPATLRGRVDVLVVNAPYVPTEEIEMMPREARLHEPRAALDGGADGLDVHRRLAACAHDWLSARGHVLVETGQSQAQRTIEIFTAGGLHARAVSCDDLDAAVVIGARTSSQDCG
jgi:release factor glutamine methyltransferase